MSQHYINQLPLQPSGQPFNSFYSLFLTADPDLNQDPALLRCSLYKWSLHYSLPECNKKPVFFVGRVHIFIRHVNTLHQYVTQSKYIFDARYEPSFVTFSNQNWGFDIPFVSRWLVRISNWPSGGSLVLGLVGTAPPPAPPPLSTLFWVKRTKKNRIRKKKPPLHLPPLFPLPPPPPLAQGKDPPLLSLSTGNSGSWDAL